MKIRESDKHFEETLYRLDPFSVFIQFQSEIWLKSLSFVLKANTD